jgi:predicted DNA repair protein MutK
MASGFFALFDDIATLMDDVAAMSKSTTQKTAGLLADDLAVNAEKASGFVAARELPILWEITKGSFLNKLIILPIAFLLSAYLPVVITPILLIGGVYLSFEGVEKIYAYFFNKKEKKQYNLDTKMTKEEILAHEKKKIKSAILVDFILSTEIIMIALGNVVEEDLMMQIIVVTVVAILATVGVYGLVGLLVRMDDLGLGLIARSDDKTSFVAKVGKGLVKSLPKIIRGLTVLGTIAMLLVGGGLFLHNIAYLHDLFHALPSMLAELIVGLLVGIIALLLFKLFKLVKTNIK